MGLIKAGIGALGGTLAEQWKEFFCCDAMDMDTLVVKGQKRVSGRSSNTKGNDNIISNGSGIAVGASFYFSSPTMFASALWKAGSSMTPTLSMMRMFIS